MKTILNTLAVTIERCQDPGVYPSGAGAGPLPSYDYPAGLSGSVVVEVDTQDVEDFGDASALLAAVEEHATEELPAGVTVRRWEAARDGARFTLWAYDVEFAPGYEQPGALCDPGEWYAARLDAMRFEAINRRTGHEWRVSRVYGSLFHRVTGEGLEVLVRDGACDCGGPRVEGHCPHTAAARAVERSLQVEAAAEVIRQRRRLKEAGKAA